MLVLPLHPLAIPSLPYAVIAFSCRPGKPSSLAEENVLDKCPFVLVLFRCWLWLIRLLDSSVFSVAFSLITPFTYVFVIDLVLCGLFTGHLGTAFNGVGLDFKISQPSSSGEEVRSKTKISKGSSFRAFFAHEGPEAVRQLNREENAKCYLKHSKVVFTKKRERGDSHFL